MNARNCFCLLALVAVAVGCRTGKYTAHDLPQPLRIPPAPASASVNLEQLGGAGIGTSEIGPGDLVQITIASGSGDERVTPVPARVARDGTVMVPLIGPVPIAGVEPVAAEQRIAAAAIERGIYHQPYVTLTVAEQAVNQVTVLGAVGKPGVVKLPRGSSDLANALAAAGGLAKNASNQVEILRRGSSTQLAENAVEATQPGAEGVRLASYADPTKPAAVNFAAPPPLDEQVRSGPPTAANAPAQMTRINLAEAQAAPSDQHKLNDRDVVMVLADETRVIHVTGLVRKPNQFVLARDKDIHVLDAVAMAGGVISPLANKVYVIRQLPGMPEPAIIQVSLSAAKRDGNENIRLAAGDLVSVEATASTMALDTVSKFFRVAIGLSGRVSVF